jgi:CheY-specific phosphatase CheX
VVADKVRAALVASVEEVLETMCFTGVIASGEAEAGLAEGGMAPELTAELQFTGDSRGGIRVGLPMKLAHSVGAGFLGREEADVSDSDAEHVVCELANMICGSVLSRLRNNATFHIGKRGVDTLERFAGCERAGVNRWFDLGTGVVSVALVLRPAA